MPYTKRRIYATEFKESSVKLALETKRPIAHTAKDLGITPDILYSWMDKYSPKDTKMSTNTNDQLHEEVKRLKKELAKITEERDLLKKAAAYFAKESR